MSATSEYAIEKAKEKLKYYSSKDYDCMERFCKLTELSDTACKLEYCFGLSSITLLVQKYYRCNDAYQIESCFVKAENFKPNLLEYLQIPEESHLDSEEADRILMLVYFINKQLTES